ncbi:hypothetical protein BH09ACT8_BH09ACT8_05380 [soil metagenome]
MRAAVLTTLLQLLTGNRREHHAALVRETAALREVGELDSRPHPHEYSRSHFWVAREATQSATTARKVAIIVS